MLPQLLISRQPIITRCKGRCSQLDTRPLIIQYIWVWKRRGLAPLKAGTLSRHPKWVETSHNQHRLSLFLFFFFFTLSFKGLKRVCALFPQRRTLREHMPVRGPGSHAILARHCTNCARLCVEKKRGREGEARRRAGLCVCVKKATGSCA